jgi:hypothetical protein
MYCIPIVYKGGEPDAYEASVQVMRWGEPLAEAGYSEGDLLRAMIAAVVKKFDPAEGLQIETWSDGKTASKQISRLIDRQLGNR